MDSQLWYVGYQALFAIPALLTVIALLYLVSRGLPERQERINAVRAFVAYCYAMIGLGVVAGIVGLVLFIRIGMMAAFEVESTGSDLTLASVVTGTGLVIALLHTVAKSTVRRRALDDITVAKRLYISWLTFALGIATVVTIPLAIYRLARYYLETITPNPPATELALVIVVLLMWAYYLLRLLRETEKCD